MNKSKKNTLRPSSQENFFLASVAVYLCDILAPSRFFANSLPFGRRSCEFVSKRSVAPLIIAYFRFCQFVFMGMKLPFLLLFFSNFEFFSCAFDAFIFSTSFAKFEVR